MYREPAPPCELFYVALPDLSDEVVGHSLAPVRDGDHIGLRREGRTVLAHPSEPEGNREGQRGDPVVVIPGKHSPVFLGHEVVEERLCSRPLLYREAEELGQPLVTHLVRLIQPQVHPIGALLHNGPELLGKLSDNVFRLASSHKCPFPRRASESLLVPSLNVYLLDDLAVLQLKRRCR